MPSIVINSRTAIINTTFQKELLSPPNVTFPSLSQALQQISSLSSISLPNILKIWREIKAKRISASAAKDSVILKQELASLAASSSAHPLTCLSILSKANHILVSLLLLRFSSHASSCAACTIFLQ
jgi:hypothetical protein